MVMHARKLPRLGDGYFERNQTHQYQNSNKYSKVGYNERYNEKMRDSPSNGSAYRNESPDGSRPSPRDRSYHNKASYSQRVKEREREKDSSKSPKDKSKTNADREHHHSYRSLDGSSSSEHRSNHDRTNNSEDKEKEKEKRLQVGDWSEHISSSGKKYYYNCKTEVSQWEKPKEWIEWERQQGKVSIDSNKIKEIGHDKSLIDKHSNERISRTSSHHHHPVSRSYEDRHHLKAVSATSTNMTTTSRGHSSQQGEHHRNSHLQFKEDQMRHAERLDQRPSRDMGRRDGERRSKSRKSSEDSQTQDMDISSDSTPPLSQCDSHSQTQTPVSFSNQHCSSQQTPPPVGGTSLANLPKLLSQLTGSKGLPNLEKQELSAHEALQTLQTALLLTRQVTLAHSNIPGQSPHSTCQQSDTSPFLTQRSPVPVTSQGQMMPLSLGLQEQKMRGEDERDRVRSSPGSEYSHRSSRRDSPTSSISSLQGIPTTGTTSLASAALRPAVPTLSPSLANYFREDLIGHVMGWQADHAERQANKYSEEAHNIGSLTCTKVSAELKTARSLVRVAEIQSTLQEQRLNLLLKLSSVHLDAPAIGQKAVLGHARKPPKTR